MAKIPRLNMFEEDDKKKDLPMTDIFTTDTKIEAVYDEVLLGLFGGQKKIIIDDIEISAKELKELYKPMKLSGKVFREVVKAHDAVLTYGKKTANERVIVIDKDTGAIVDDQCGTRNEVKFYVPLAYKGNLITVHNHPSDNTLSPKDLYTFNDIRQIKCSVVQGHGGSLYAIEKPDCTKYKIKEDYFNEVFDNIIQSNAYKGKPLGIQLERFVITSAPVFKWKYRRGENNK